MVHLSLLPFHTQWEGLFHHLRFVVIDELHTYKGIFGSHLAQVIRRLGRVCDFYGSRPQYIACSATIANPRNFAEKLTGLPFESIEESGAPRAGRHFLFLNPTASPYTLAAKLFIDCLDAGFRTLVFTQARKITELLHAWILKDRPQLKNRVSSYRAGFLPEERREIEAKLVSGEMWGVISTSALELGIDIGGLDVCILVGYPGTVAATWQRGGRVGRADRESLVALLAQPDALDQYFMRHPEDFFSRGFESAVVDPDNPVVVAKHLVCAGAEVPLRTDETLFPLPKYASILDQLVAEGELLKSASGKEWFSHRLQPHRFVDIRSAGEGYTIFEEGTKRVIGQIGTPRVYSECHPGAIYLHKAESYRVKQLDQGKREVWAEAAEVDYYTKALSEKETEILSVVRSRPMFNFNACYGKLKVTERVRGFEKRRIFGQELLSVHELEMPSHIFETMGLWMVLPEDLSRRVKEAGLHFMGGIHAIEHAAISSISPLCPVRPQRCGRDLLPGSPPARKTGDFHLRRLPRRRGSGRPRIRNSGGAFAEDPRFDPGVPLLGRVPLLYPFAQMRIGKQAPGQRGGGRSARLSIGGGGLGNKKGRKGEGGKYFGAGRGGSSAGFRLERTRSRGEDRPPGMAQRGNAERAASFSWTSKPSAAPRRWGAGRTSTSCGWRRR